ncbi:ATP-binding protein [Streptomyces sp. JJ36]|nr:ATP-binding protein [Streptomyces sp. JJ36]
MRQPLESGHVVVARAGGMVRMPTRFLLVLAANPCPCGRHGVRGGWCECRPASVRRYRARLCGLLLDRVDLRVTVEPLTRSELTALGGAGESSATVAERVRTAREWAATRFADPADHPGPPRQAPLAHRAQLPGDEAGLGLAHFEGPPGEAGTTTSPSSLSRTPSAPCSDRPGPQETRRRPEPLPSRPRVSGPPRALGRRLPHLPPRHTHPNTHLTQHY